MCPKSLSSSEFISLTVLFYSVQLKIDIDFFRPPAVQRGSVPMCFLYGGGMARSLSHDGEKNAQYEERDMNHLKYRNS